MAEDSEKEAPKFDLNESGDIVIKLKKPLVLSGATLEELVIVEPNAGQIAQSEQAGPNEINKAIVLLSLCTGKPKEVIKQVCYSDFKKANDALQSFLPDGQKIGETV